MCVYMCVCISAKASKDWSSEWLLCVCVCVCMCVSTGWSSECFLFLLSICAYEDQSPECFVCVCACVFSFLLTSSHRGWWGGAFFQQQVRACPHNAYCGSSGCSLSVLASMYIRIGPHYDLCV